MFAAQSEERLNHFACSPSDAVVKDSETPADVLKSGRFSVRTLRVVMLTSGVTNFRERLAATHSVHPCCDINVAH